MSILALALFLGAIYIWSQFAELRKEQKALKTKLEAFQYSVSHFLNNSGVLKGDVATYKEIPLLEKRFKDFTVFGEMRGAIFDRTRYIYWLDEKEGTPEIDLLPDPDGDKFNQQVRSKASQILSATQQTHSCLIPKSYIEWFELSWSNDYVSLECLRWMIPEIEEKLASKKVPIPADLQKLKSALISGNWNILIPDLLKNSAKHD